MRPTAKSTDSTKKEWKVFMKNGKEITQSMVKAKTNRRRLSHFWPTKITVEKLRSMYTRNGGNETDGRRNAL